MTTSASTSTSSSHETGASKAAGPSGAPQPFKAEVAEVLRLVVNSLYSHKEIFLRELISNASDALDKLRFQAIAEPGLLSGEPLRIRITPDSEQKTLTLSDTGIGMTEAELGENLGTIARSGTREFARRIAEAKSTENPSLIGQFGVGFYSAYLVADRVTVTSRAAGSEQAFRWSSDAKETFTVEPAELATHGTEVVLHLKDDCLEFLEPYRIRSLVQRYSDYVGHPIELLKKPAGEGEDAAEYETINRASALWARAPKDVTTEQYEEFYKHLTHDWEAPLAHRHFRVEGTQMFTGLLFLPNRPPFDLFDAEAEHGVRLHVRRVFIMDNCAELVPRYLRFLRGVIDSEDLPLNVSREILQDSQQVRVIKKQVVSHALSMIESLAEEQPEKFTQFWTQFGAVLKEGLHFDGDARERVAKLVRYESSTVEGLTSLTDYVTRMKEGQAAIYYAIGASKKAISSGPHIENLKKLGYEVLLMTDPIDSFAVDGLKEFAGKPLVSAMASDLKLEESAASEAEAKIREEKAQPLLERVRKILDKEVSEVRASKRLADSPVCLVVPEGGLAPHIERLLRMRNGSLPAQKRILEVNLEHPIVVALGKLDPESQSSDVEEWVLALYDQALIAEGSPVEDPGSSSRRLTRLLSRAIGSP